MAVGVNRLSNNRNLDRISILPEAILSQILSLLPTQDAVRTSALSRTWKNRWTSINVLEFDDCLHNHSSNKYVTNFKQFVDYVFLRLQDSRIEDIYISFSDPSNFSQIRSWVVEAERRKVKGIYIRAFAEEQLTLPLNLYDWDSLENMILKTNCLLGVPETMSFSGVKFLDLTSVRFFNKGSMSKVIRLSFPILETLILERCEYLDVEVVNINAPLLTDFTLIDSAYKQGKHDRSRTLMIDGSNIDAFNLSGYSYVNFNLVNPSSVDTVNIKLSSLLNLDHKLKISSVLRDLLHQITNVRDLTISYGTIEVLSCIKGLEGGLPTFKNLLKMELNLMNAAYSATLTSLLKSMPVLETLIFTLVTSYKVEEKMFTVPSCRCLPLPSLKVIKVKEFHGTTLETELVKLLIKIAEVLEVMVIIASQDFSSNPKKFEAMKNRIKVFPRGSAELSILFA